MITSIKNEFLEITVDSYGAELTSIKTICDGMEFLRQKDSRYCSRQAPVLFPIVGSLPDGRYLFENKTYQMNIHGFARDCEFEPIKNDLSELGFRLKYNQETMLQYPFKFEFIVKYALEANTLWQSFSVNNCDKKSMLFSVGAHPGFRCPLYEGETMEVYYLLFEKTEHLQRRIKNGIDKTGDMLSGETKPFLNGERKKALSHGLFYEGPIILESLASKWLEIRSRVNRRVVRVGFAGFPYLGIWSSKNDAPFVCIEPWYGIDSTRGEPLDFEVKEGLQKLAPGEFFDCKYSITVE
jgi:galactose mutarotase-like enzyme